MTHRIFTRIPDGDPAVIEAIGQSSVADLHEAMETIPGRMSLLDPAIAPLNRGLKIVGQAVTAHVFPGDGLAAYRALQLAGAGQVLVVTTAGQASTPMFAELVSLAAREKGLAGVVVDGPVRDSDALRKDHFPVWCRGTYGLGSCAEARTGRSQRSHRLRGRGDRAGRCHYRRWRRSAAHPARRRPRALSVAQSNT